MVCIIIVIIVALYVQHVCLKIKRRIEIRKQNDKTEMGCPESHLVRIVGSSRIAVYVG